MKGISIEERAVNLAHYIIDTKEKPNKNDLNINIIMDIIIPKIDIPSIHISKIYIK